MAGSLAGQSVLSLTGEAAGQQFPCLLDRLAPSAALPEQQDQHGCSTHHPEEMAEMSHHHGQRKAAGSPVQGESPSFRDSAGDRGTLCWADRLLCQAHRPELEEREDGYGGISCREKPAQHFQYPGDGDSLGLTQAPQRPWQPHGIWDGLTYLPTVHFLRDVICFPPTEQLLEKQVHPRSTLFFFFKRFLN